MIQGEQKTVAAVFMVSLQFDGANNHGSNKVWSDLRKLNQLLYDKPSNPFEDHLPESLTRTPIDIIQVVNVCCQKGDCEQISRGTKIHLEALLYSIQAGWQKQVDRNVSVRHTFISLQELDKFPSEVVADCVPQIKSCVNELKLITNNHSIGEALTFTDLANLFVCSRVSSGSEMRALNQNRGFLFEGYVLAFLSSRLPVQMLLLSTTSPEDQACEQAAKRARISEEV